MSKSLNRVSVSSYFSWSKAAKLRKSKQKDEDVLCSMTALEAFSLCVEVADGAFTVILQSAET